MEFISDDGGREAAGFKGKAGDCVARSIAIVTQRPYREIYDALALIEGARKQTKRMKKKASASARNGVYTQRKAFKDYMAGLGFKWVPTMQIGSGCKVHLRADELPSGRLVASLSRHMCAVIDGVPHDTYDPSRNGTRCVYGYWQLS